MRALAFDVFGTLLDPSAVPKALAGIAPDPGAFAGTWRSKQLEYTFLMAAMERRLPFAEVTWRALRQAAAIHRTELSEDRAKALLAVWSTLPPFPDVREALEGLRARYTLAVLSNGDPEGLEVVLKNAGIRDLLDPVISAAEVGAFKPARAVYVRAVERLGLPIRQVALVSSNAFDVIGAKAAGLRAIWVNRQGAVLDDLGPRPDFEVRDMASLAAALLPSKG